MPSARTSVGNKEYEYKGKKECAAKPQQAGDRREAGRFGVAAVAVALRHAVDTTAARRRVSTVTCEIFFGLAGETVWTAGRLDVRTVGGRAGGLRAYAAHGKRGVHRPCSPDSGRRWNRFRQSPAGTPVPRAPWAGAQVRRSGRCCNAKSMWRSCQNRSVLAIRPS